MSEILSGQDLAASMAERFGGIEGIFAAGEEYVDAPDDGDTVPETDTKGPLRDPESGRFVSRSEELEDDEVVDEPEETSETTTEEPSDEEETPEETVEDEDEFEEIELDAEMLGIPEDHPLFTKYGGDLSKALGALGESQSTVGRLGQELGDLRAELRELRENPPQQQPAPPPINWHGAIEFANEQDDPSEAFAYLANAAYENADELGMRMVYEAWKEEDPGNALEWRQNLMLEYMSQQREGAPPAEGNLQSGGDQRQREEAVAEVIGRHPDLERFVPKIGELALARPVLGKALREGSPKEQAQALEDLYLLARSLGADPDTSTSARKIALRVKAENDDAKRSASVVSATKQSAVKPTTQENVSEFKRLFREATGQSDD